MSFRLLVNPAAANGRALRRLPKVTDELQRLGVDPVVIQTRSLEHTRARRRPRPRARAARSARWAATASSARWPARCAAPTRALAVIPGGRGNDFARVLGHPPRAGARPPGWP